MNKRLIVLFALLSLVMSAGDAGALVMCVKKRPKTGDINPASPVRVKASCANNEIQINPADLGLGGVSASLGFQTVRPFGEVEISNVTINGASVAQVVAPGAAFALDFDYFIKDTACPGCIDQIQIGFADQNPVACGYHGQPGSGGVSGTANLMLTAPSTPGTYYMGFDRSQAFSCLNAWWSSPPNPYRYIAVVTVQ